MKVIKRDGRAVDYDRNKIITAIEKANKEVNPSNKVTKQEIIEIVTYIEELNKKRMLVEDIQDIIEEKLMELKKYELAKKYIVYRYTRALVRKQNTTDETILGIIRNENREDYDNQNIMSVAQQRNYIAGEVSRDLTKRLLLPEKIAKAESEGILYFHNAEYFVHPMINSSLINISDMLNLGTVINGEKIETPKSFLVAIMIMTQIMGVVSNSQYGGQSIDIIHLGKYLRETYNHSKKQVKESIENIEEKQVNKIATKRVETELKYGIQILKYQINTLREINGKEPNITLFMHLKEDDEYIEENAMIIEEILKQVCEEKQDKRNNLISTKLIYVLDELNSLKGGKYDYLTRLAIKCTEKGNGPIYISSKKMKENFKDNIFSPIGENEFLTLYKDKEKSYKFEGRFNQGMVSINLPQIAIIADGNENEFWRLLDERLDLCFEALMCRHYSLIGTQAQVSPILWMYGGIARLQEHETINELLYNGYSTISLGYVGIYEMTKLIKGVSHIEQEGQKFALKVIKHLKEVIEYWKEKSSIDFVLCGVNSIETLKRFVRKDKEKYGTIKDITEKTAYTGSYLIPEDDNVNSYEKLRLESEFQKLSSGGAISYINICKNEDDIEKLIGFIYDNVQYVQIVVNK